MAKKLTDTAPDTDTASDDKVLALPAPAPASAVLLYAQDLGETRAFTPAAAKRLLAFQAAKGYTHWQPAAEHPAA